MAKNKQAFTLLEALLALALLGLILMLMTPIIAARTSRVSDVNCVQGGTETRDLANPGVFDVKPGMSVVYITAVIPGNNGSGAGGQSGGNGGTANLPVYVNNGSGINLLDGSIRNINYELDGAYLKITINRYRGATLSSSETKKYHFDAQDEATAATAVTTEPQKGMTTSGVRNGYNYKNGIPQFGTFRGPTFGAGGRGANSNYVNRVDNAKTPLHNNKLIFFEWPTNCVVTSS